MYKTRPSSNSKKISHNISKNYPTKKLSKILTTNKKIRINISNFLPISLVKSRSIVPISSNTLRNQNSNKLKNSFDNLLNNQKTLRNSTIKNRSLITTILKPNSKSKSKSKKKRGVSSQNPKINNMKNTSYLSNNELIKNIVLYRKNYKNRKNIVNNSKKKSNSIRCSLTYINRCFNVTKPDRPKIKYGNFICVTSNNNNKNFNINLVSDKKNKRWEELHKKLEKLKAKTNSLLNKYYTLSENLNNELEILSSNYDNNIFANSKSYDYRKKLLMYDKIKDEQLFNELLDNKYINTDVNNV